MYTHYIPINIISDNINEYTFYNKLKLKRLSKEEICKIWRINDFELDGNGYLKSLKKTKDSFIFYRSNTEDLAFLIGANYYLELKDERSLGVLFNYALKLFKHGKAGFLLGICEPPTRAAMFNYPNPLYGDKYALNRNELPEFDNLMKLIESKLKNEFFNSIINRLLYSISKEIKDINRLIEFISILESIYVEDSFHGEMSYKLRIRASKILSELHDSQTVFQDLKNATKFRGAWLHSSKGNKVKEIIPRLEEYVRNSLKIYLKGESQFKPDVIDKLIIQEWEKVELANIT